MYAAARSSGVRVVSEVRSSHLPSRCASRLAAPWSTRSSPALVRRRYRRRPGLVFSDPTSSSRLRGGPGVRAVDEVAQVGDEVGPHDCVPFGWLGVVADHEPLRPRPVVAVAVAAGRDVDLFDPQVARDGRVPAGAGQRGGGLGEGAP